MRESARSTRAKTGSGKGPPPAGLAGVPSPSRAPTSAATPHIAEDHVVREAARDRAALAAVLDPVITIDSRGTIQSASDSVERVLGWKPAELLGRNVNMLMPEPHHSAHDGYLATYQRTGKTNIMNRARRFEALRRDGTRVPIELCVSRAEVPGGAPLFVGIIRDMSAVAAAERSRDEERVLAQQQLAEQTAALQTAHTRLRIADRMASIGTLAAGLGHDMNNVLLPVRARLNALRAAGEAGRLAAGERQHVDEIRKSVAYLQQLADGLHFLALDPEVDENERGGGAATDIVHWWSQTGTLLSKPVPKHVRVSANLPPRLPTVALAAHGLTQAVLNLVVNAGEAIPGPSERKRRQGHVRIWADTMRENGAHWVRLGVTDNGSGMTDEVKRRAVEMFFTTKPRGLGTGLGLALVHKVVTRAGGRIDIQSEVGKGTTVTMYLPACGGEPDAPKLEAAVSVPDGRAASVISHMLERSGVGVVDASDERAMIWVLAPATAQPEQVRRWAAARPGRRVVLFGAPPRAQAGAWATVSPIIIDRPNELDMVRKGLGRAVAQD